MAYYVITESGVETYRSKVAMGRDVSLDKHEMVQLGNDYVVKLTDHDFDIAKDIRQLEMVASKKMFAKDKFDLTNWLQVIAIVIILFTR